MALILDVTAAFARCPERESSYNCYPAAVPQEILSRADEYIATATSRSYQATHYTLLPKQAATNRAGGCGGFLAGYSLWYSYAPLPSDPSATAAVRVYVPALVDCPVTGSVIVEGAAGAMVEPTVLRGEAVRLAASQWQTIPADWTTSSSLSLVWSQPEGGWEWRVEFAAPGSGCRPRKGASIDATTGRIVSKFDDGITCE
jgi:hypothetical protein